MREILFRGQKADTKEWLFGDLIQLEKDFKKVVEILDWSKVNNKKKSKSDLTVISETVGQFTGLTDKNGVKIFEGDIITVNSKIVKQVRINDTFLAVQVANKEDLKFIDLLDPWQTPGEVWWNDFGREIIVIGSIHDNPELPNNQPNVK